MNHRHHQSVLKEIKKLHTPFLRFTTTEERLARAVVIPNNTAAEDGDKTCGHAI